MKIIKWALWSNRHLVLSVAAAVALVGVLSFGLASITPDKRAHESARAPGDASARAATGGASASAQPITDLEGTVIARARAFSTAWLDTSDGWFERVRPNIDPALEPSMRATNLDAIPDASVLDVTPELSSQVSAQATVALTDGTQLRLTLVRKGGEWKVVSVLPGDGS